MMKTRMFTNLVGAIALSWCAGAAVWAAPETKPALTEGTAAPVFRLRAIDGSMVRLDELAYPGKEKSYAKKRPTFIDFFRTDCQPCIKAMPELIALSEKYASQGVEFVLVSLLEEDQGRAKLDKFLASQKLPFKIVVDENEHFAKKYLGETAQLPGSFLVDENGIVKKAKYGASGSYEAHFGEQITAVLAKWKGTQK